MYFKIWTIQTLIWARAFIKLKIHGRCHLILNKWNTLDILQIFSFIYFHSLWILCAESLVCPLFSSYFVISLQHLHTNISTFDSVMFLMKNYHLLWFKYYWVVQLNVFWRSPLIEFDCKMHIFVNMMHTFCFYKDHWC